MKVKSYLNCTHTYPFCRGRNPGSAKVGLATAGDVGSKRGFSPSFRTKAQLKCTNAIRMIIVGYTAQVQS
jgi:hypothetical protein